MEAADLKRIRNWKRVYRVYKAMELNQPRRTKRRLPVREPLALLLPLRPNQIWSADFMSDALHYGLRFRTFNVIDDYNREALVIEIDPSLRAERLIRVFTRLRHTRGFPDMLRVDNGPEFLSTHFINA
jgi:putative transposase